MVVRAFGYGVEELLELRAVLVEGLLAHLERRVVDREEALVVLDERQAETLDAAVRGEHLAEVARVALVRALVDDAGVEERDVVLWELEVVLLLEAREPVVARIELALHANRCLVGVVLDEGFQVGELLDAHVLVGLFADREGVGVVEWGGVEKLQVVLFEVGLRSGVVLFLAIRDRLGVAQVADPDRPRVLPVHVYVAVDKGLPGRVGTGQPDLVLHACPGVFEGLERDVAQDQLLGEVLGADDQAGVGEVHATATPAAPSAARGHHRHHCQNADHSQHGLAH